MNTAVFLTVTDRADYLKQVLNSWSKVRGLYKIPFYIRIEPSKNLGEVYRLCAEFEHPRKQIHINPTCLGVLHHPWVGFDKLFGMGYDFVIRAEDDLLVSSDIIEYFNWTSEKYLLHPSVGAVLAYSENDGPESGIEYTKSFNPWVWGTWSSRWRSYFRESWDHDYSTFNETPGNESGWDWNIDTRIYPNLSLVSVAPLQSRVQNIGEWGVHGTPEILRTSDSFSSSRPTVSYSMSDSREYDERGRNSGDKFSVR